LPFVGGTSKRPCNPALDSIASNDGWAHRSAARSLDPPRGDRGDRCRESDDCGQRDDPPTRAGASEATPRAVGLGRASLLGSQYTTERTERVLVTTAELARREVALHPERSFQRELSIEIGAELSARMLAAAIHQRIATA
jgi:hypothetical protein